MSRVTRPLFALALLTCASFAHADALRLIAPTDHATLRGGSFAELRWSATDLPPSAEEWEAFLSIDGGKYYAFRITPHLDIDLERFTFLVPNVDARDARILIRTGDEVRESHFEARGSFSIVRDPDAEHVLPRVLQYGRGEAARDGDPGVVSWTDGSRNGSAISQRSAPASPFPSFDRLCRQSHDGSPAVAPTANSVEVLSLANTPLPARDKHARRAESIAKSVDLLLVCRRRNI